MKTNPTKLLPTDLIAIEIPIDATNVSIGSEGFCIYFTNELKLKHIDLSFGKLEIIGEITHDSISDKLAIFLKEHLELDFYTFIDFLQSKELYFVNPIEKPISFNKLETKYDLETYKNHREKWKEAENNLIKGKLIILKEIS